MEKRQRIAVEAAALIGAACFAGLCPGACAKPEERQDKTASIEKETGNKVSDNAASSSSAVPGGRGGLPAFDPKNSVSLLPPEQDTGISLMTALARRSSSRSFSSRSLDMRILSDLFWSATGVNRPDTGKRTAPTARDRRDMDVYAAFAKGLYLYDIEKHALVPILGEDIRAATGVQEFAATAPLNLIFVADLTETAGENREEKLIYAGSHAGFISQNVYLFSASAGLATVVRGAFDKEKLAEAMHLRPDQMIVLTQTVGFPAPSDTAE